MKKPGPKGDGPEGAGAPFNDAFASLKALKERVPEGAKANGPEARRAPARAVVRLERKGRGGKEVTVLEQLELSLVERSTWLKDLKGALGCGGAVEGDALILQGDQRERVRAWLEGRGVKRISVG